MYLTHWGRVTHICVSKLTTIGSNNGLSPGRRQAIIWISAGILLIGPLGTNFSEILIGIHTFSFKEMHSKLSSAKWRPFCLGLNELKPFHKLSLGNIVQWWNTITLYTVLQQLRQNLIRGWTHNRHPIHRPYGWAMGCLLWGFKRKLTTL